MSAERPVAVLFAASAAGEIAVGAVGLVFPQVLALLLDVSLDAAGLLAARLLGSAVLALGLTWWIARREPAGQGIGRCAAGYLVYNLAVGLLFSLRALAAARPALPWLVGVAHVLAGLGFGVALWRRVAKA
jgi:hypothetical protein